MHAFSARAATARTSNLASWLVRAVTYGLPTLAWEEQGGRYALVLALFLGALDGWFRLRVARNARSFVADADGLLISSGFDSARVDWSNLLAIEVWHRLNGVDYVAVHYRTTNGNSVSTCWDQNGRDELLLFVRQCAAFAQAAGADRKVARVHLGDRPVYLTLLRRLSLDLAMALLVGIASGIASHAIWLAAAAGLLSAAIAATPYLRHSDLVRSDGEWWQRRSNGELTRLGVMPRSLRLWADCLSHCRCGSVAGNACSVLG